MNGWYVSGFLFKEVYLLVEVLIELSVQMVAVHHSGTVLYTLTTFLVSFHV
jgi:hypothetical protein